MKKPKWSVNLSAGYSLPSYTDTNGLDQNFNLAVLGLANDFLKKNPKAQALVAELENELGAYMDKVGNFIVGDMHSNE